MRPDDGQSPQLHTTGEQIECLQQKTGIGKDHPEIASDIEKDSEDNE